ncbi:GtrA family protein [Paenibacillus sp. NPDC055715]
MCFSCSLIISYYINKKWTFSNRDVKSMAFLKYFMVSCSGLLLNLLILHVLVNIFSVWYTWVQMVIIVVVPLSNLFLNKFWTF